MSATIVAGDFGYELQIPTTGGIDFRSATAISLVIDTLSITLSMTAGTTTQTINGVSYTAGTWVYRNVLAGDIPVSPCGQFRARVVYVDSSSKLTSTAFFLTVNSP